MKLYALFGFAALGLIAQPASANYPCPSGPGPGEQQIGVAGGSHGIASVPLCVATGGVYSGGGGYSGGANGGYTCPGCNIFADPNPLTAKDIARGIDEEKAKNLQVQKLMQEVQEKRQKLEGDPEYQSHKQGAWKIFQGKKDSAPGDNCVAMWSKVGGAVSIVGPSKAYEGGMLIFWSADIPRLSKTQTVAVTLKQSKYKPQSVNALNFTVPDIPAGAIGLTVPNIEAALKTMLDVEHFVIEMDGRTVADVDWTDGLAARTKLSKCVAKR
jgi:hypothetical protein